MKRVILFFLVHVTVWTGLVLLVPGDDRVDYDVLGDASTPWIRQFVVALIAVLIVQIVFITRTNMWRDVLRDRPRSTSAWMWLPPTALALVGVAAFVSKGLSDAPRSYWIGMTITMFLVGLTEEITFRGIVVAGTRRAGGSESRALLVSSGLFGLFHLPNWLLGQDLSATARQVLVTAVIGTVFYALRRASGTLITCIVLHAAYDWMLIQGSFA